MTRSAVAEPNPLQRLAQDHGVELADLRLLAQATHGRYDRIDDGALRGEINDASQRVWQALGNDGAHALWTRLREVTQP